MHFTIFLSSLGKSTKLKMHSVECWADEDAFPCKTNTLIKWEHVRDKARSSDSENSHKVQIIFRGADDRVGFVCKHLGGSPACSTLSSFLRQRAGTRVKAEVKAWSRNRNINLAYQRRVMLASRI